MKNFLQLIRAHQWVKNLFVFLPLFFSGELFLADSFEINIPLFTKAFIAFWVFCFTASMVYIINDYMDVEEDKKHPTKKNRPLASGAITKSQALITVLVLFSLVVAGLQYLNIKVSYLIAFYFVMNLAYTFKLKHVAIVDVTIIAIGFLLRVFVGGYATGIVVTPWTQVLVFCLALLMALGKRRGEIENADKKGLTRKALDGYNLAFVNYSLIIVSAITIMAYLMFCLSPSALEKFHNYIFYTFILVFVGILRYLQQTFVYNKTESPTKMVYTDHFLQGIVVLFLVSYMFLIYYK